MKVWLVWWTNEQYETEIAGVLASEDAVDRFIDQHHDAANCYASAHEVQG